MKESVPTFESFLLDGVFRSMFGLFGAPLVSVDRLQRNSVKQRTCPLRLLAVLGICFQHSMHGANRRKVQSRMHSCVLERFRGFGLHRDSWCATRNSSPADGSTVIGPRQDKLSQRYICKVKVRQEPVSRTTHFSWELRARILPAPGNG
jgi:hypothetical protein